LTDVRDALERLRQRFRGRAAADLEDLRKWSADPVAHKGELHALIHRLAGAAGTFGFDRLSELAAKAEDELVASGSARAGILNDVIGELVRVGGGA
jgi:HPt (histidine-containing phosphotransfer) domain-containing protein